MPAMGAVFASASRTFRRPVAFLLASLYFMTGPKPRALIVDDDEPIRSMLARVVEHQGFMVTTAKDGVEAIEQLEHDGFNVVLLDLMMPRVDGYGVLNWMR